MEKAVEILDKSKIADLFAGWEETLIWSCLQDCMGRAYADTEEDPQSAQIVVGDFVSLRESPLHGLCGINRMTGNLSLSLWYRLLQIGRI